MRASQPRKTKTNQPPAYGRGTGIPHPIDVHVGTRIRTRRLFLGMTQEQLASVLGVSFQQQQKYEKGDNRISAARLAAIADALRVPISYFFAQIETSDCQPSRAEQRLGDLQNQPETIKLVRSFYAIPDEAVRSRFLAMVKAVAGSLE
jgi:transcriptional regulator with XRE-family HTH domain